MEKIVLKGGKPLTGEVQIYGAKNAALPILVATLLAKEGKSKIKNVPKLSDIKILSELFKSLGAKVEYKPEESTMIIDATDSLKTEASEEYVSKMRAAFLVLGPILAREKVARVSMPGGCSIGTRPIDQHLKGFEKLGASIVQEAGYIEARAKDGLVGTTIFLDFPSVGGTQNLIMASCLAKGTTKIINAAEEPEIADLINLLNKMGAKIQGKGTSVLEIEGVEKLKGIEYTVMPDRVEAATYMIAAAITKGDVLVKDARYEDNEALVLKMREMGVDIEVLGNDMRVKNTSGKLKSTDFKTLPHPGFLTDMQSIVAVLASISEGVSTITETVFESRFTYTEELNKMKTKIRASGDTAIIEGPCQLQGAHVEATDLRAGAALILAGLVAKGETVVSELHHVDRGYADIEEKLRNLGATIERITE